MRIASAMSIASSPIWPNRSCGLHQGQLSWRAKSGKAEIIYPPISRLPPKCCHDAPSLAGDGTALPLYRSCRCRRRGGRFLLLLKLLHFPLQQGAEVVG